MRIKKSYSYEEFDVCCRNCEKTIVVEDPEDLSKEVQDGEEIFCLICPNCVSEIWFDGSVLMVEFRKLVKTKNNDFREIERQKDKCLNYIPNNYIPNTYLSDVIVWPNGKRYSFSKDAICTLPKCGGDDRFRPSVIAKRLAKDKK